MSFLYLALYRKYRSKTFDEVISQEHITTTLKNQIKAGKPAHAYLFTGSRGTGKTTCAKLMAKAVNCLSPIDGSPCGECEVCRAIADGCPDIIEMDAASNNGVDDVRALRDEVMYTPVMCRYKVYIIDEVHMMSGSAFNALLKTIEEPPAHVIFILATTEIQKVPATIVSRCQQFRFRRIAVEDSTKRLCEIAQNEGVQLEVAAAELISRLSDGGMRDAVSLLDQCISVSSRIDEQVVRDTAGVAGAEHLIALADCVKNQDTARALKILDELHNASKDLVLLLEEMTGHFRNLCILSSMNMDFSLIPPGSGDKAELVRQAKEFTPGEILRCIDILQESSAKAPRSAARKTLAEMCFVQLCTPRLDSDTKALSLRIEKLERLLDGKELPTSKTAAARPAEKVCEQPTPTPQPIKQEPAVRQMSQAEPQPQPTPPPQEIRKPEPKPQELPKPTEVGAPAPEPQQNDTVPSWLFEGNGGDDAMNVAATDDDEYQPHIPAVSEIQSDIQPKEDIPPFDLDDEDGNIANTAAVPQPAQPAESYPPSYDYPPIPDAPAEYSAAQSENNGLWAEINDILPMHLQATLKNVTVELTDSQIVLKNYKDFHRDMLKKGDSQARIIKAAQEITGRAYTLVFDEAEKKQATDNSDHFTEFMKKAEKMGVKIKYKK